jgi:hypothetical protein
MLEGKRSLAACCVGTVKKSAAVGVLFCHRRGFDLSSHDTILYDIWVRQI